MTNDNAPAAGAPAPATDPQKALIGATAVGLPDAMPDTITEAVTGLVAAYTRFAAPLVARLEAATATLKEATPDADAVPATANDPDAIYRANLDDAARTVAARQLGACAAAIRDMLAAPLADVADVWAAATKGAIDAAGAAETASDRLLTERNRDNLTLLDSLSDDPPVLRVRKPGLVNTAIRLRDTLDVNDGDSVPREYCKPDTAAIRKAVLTRAETVPGAAVRKAVRIDYYDPRDDDAGKNGRKGARAASTRAGAAEPDRKAA